MKNNIEQYKKEIIAVLGKIAYDKEILSLFVRDILTPREFDNLAIRWQIVKRLANKENHQAIAEALHLGVATVTRGSRELRKKEGGFQKTLKKLTK